MSFIPVMEYLAGIFAFGFVKYIFNDIIDSIRIVSTRGNTYELGLFLWAGITIVYIVGGAFYLWMKYTRPSYQQPYYLYDGRFY